MPENRSPVLSLRNVSKTFPGQKALASVDLDLHAGETRALVGPNGSGKSTLIKILAGYHQPDPGWSATVFDEPLSLGDPQAASEAGLRFVHQDLGLVPALGALDNLALGRGYERGRTGTISWRRERAAGRRLLHGLGYDVDFGEPVASLSAAERTGIAIARALQGWERSARILILDEPTAALPAAEVQRLFDVIRMVQQRGVAIIYVSHHFNEVFAVSDHVTVLRDGRHVATRPTEELDESSLVALTIGRALSVHGDRDRRLRRDAGRRVVLTARGLSGRVLRDMDFDVAAGEIVGVAGVTGSGREEVTGLVYGARPRKGEVLVDGSPVPPSRPDVSTRHRIAFVPPERTAQAALSPLTLRENTTLGALEPFSSLIGLSRRAEREETSFWLTRLDVVPPRPEAVFSTLSGGNQQKVILARVLRTEPKVLILDEPTHGVDVGAKASIHEIVREAAQSGAAVLVASTESEELVSLCDRVLVLDRGHLTADCSTHELTADELTEYTLGSGTPAAEASPERHRPSPS